MDFDLSEEQEELRRTARAVLARECPRALVRDVVENGSLPEQPWKSAVELGWTAITVPESCGGLGLGFEELGLLLEEHGRALAPGPLLATVSQFAPAVREAGSEAQKQRFLGGVARGDLTGTLAVAGGGLPSSTSPVAQRDGDAWCLEGGCRFVLDGDAAQEVAVVARVEEGDGVGLFAVPRDAVEATRLTSIDPSRPLANLVFAGVRVEPERVLGVPGRCARAVARALDEATVAMALEIVGVCQALLEVSVEYAKQRFQFGQPIGAFQAIQHKCADMLMAVEKARATAHFAMMTIGEDDPRRSLAASMAKAAAGDCQRLLCKEAIQIHGGTGFTWECDVHLFVKRAKTATALLGTTHEHRARVATLLLDA